MFEKDPLFRKVSPPNLEAYREAKRAAARHQEANDAQIERELAELDGAILGMDTASMEALRDCAELSGPEDEESSVVMKRPR
jgi:hypothetical protein